MVEYSRLPSAEVVSLAGPGGHCRLRHNDADLWDRGPRPPQGAWRVTRPCSVLFEAHEPAEFAFGTLLPGDRVRYETTYWFTQGCDNEPNVCDRFVVLTGALAGHCVSTRGAWEPDRSMFEPVGRKERK